MDLQAVKHQTIALCMIVKDEEEVILRALKSVKNFVDYYCICDTGSTDNTIQVIRDYLDDNNLSGVVVERPWVNFAHNRTEAFQFAYGKCDYLMTLDADEVFAAWDGITPQLDKRIVCLPKLEADRVNVHTYFPSLVYRRSSFLRDAAGPWTWVSPVHEVPVSPNEQTAYTLKDCCVVPSKDGARAKDPNRFLWDAFVLERAVIEEPNDHRLKFYLGQSYQDCGKTDRAIEAYLDCATKTAWEEEASVAYLRVARIYASQKNFDKALTCYWKSYNKYPSRGEALFDLLHHYRTTGEYNSGVAVGELLQKCDPKQSVLFTENEIYLWRANDELSICYYYVGRFQEGLDLAKSVISCPQTPSGELSRLRENIKWFEDAIKQTHGVS